MNESQTSLYWRLWAKACKAQAWNKAGGMKSAEVDAMRKAVTREVLGKDVSSKDFTNDQFTKIKAKFLELAGDLDGAMEVNQPTKGKARNFLHVIAEQKKCLALYVDGSVEAYVEQVIRDKFNRGRRSERMQVESLSNEPGFNTRFMRETPSELAQLVMTLAARLNTMRNEAGDTIHDMKTKSGVLCGCARCCRARALQSPCATPEIINPDETEPVHAVLVESEGQPF